MKSFIQKKINTFINEYETNCIQENCLCTCINIKLIHFLFVYIDECVCVFVGVFHVIFK